MEPLLQYQYYSDVTITILDLVFALILLIAAGIYGSNVMRKNPDPLYRFYSKALLFKLTTALVFCVLYMTSYSGDPIDYMHGINAVNKVGANNIGHYFDLIFQGNKPEFYSYFNRETSYVPTHMWRDSKTFIVIRLLSPFALITNGSLVVTSMLISWISFIFLWKMYIAFARLYPQIDTKIAIAILFMPSVVFWGSAILKDTIIITAVAIFTTAFLNIGVKGKFSTNSMIGIFISGWLMITVKPYVLVAMVPGAAIWFAHGRILKIKSKFIKYSIYPIAITLFLSIGIYSLSRLSSSLGDYASMDKMVEKAKITQEDLKRGEQYGQNYYDLGTIENSPSGLAKLMPQAIIAGLYRPFLWEARNPFVALSGLENFYTLFLTMSILIRTRIFKVFSYIGKDPVLIFSLLYTIMFAFGIGLASANFGALVRYRIPGLPFLMLSLFILDFYLKNKKVATSES